MRKILTSDSKTIQSNPRTSVYLDYIKMIEAKEEANKDAPTEEVKDNVTKIYNEVASGGFFSSLTGWIPGRPWWKSSTSATAGNPNTAGPSSSAVSAAPASQASSSSGNSLPQALLGQSGIPQALLGQSRADCLRMYAIIPIPYRYRQFPHTVPASYGELQGFLTKLKGQIEEKNFDKKFDTHFFKVEMCQMLWEILRRFHQNLKNDSNTRKELRGLTDYVLQRMRDK